MDDYPWARLRPLPEAVVAWMTLRGLPGVDSRLPIGWAPVGLMLATYVTARRPGCELRMEKRDGTLRFSAAGGTVLDRHDPVGPPTSSWVTSAANRMCELCARPAKYRHEPPGARCDVCESLRGWSRFDAELPFEPRLPLTDDAAEAQAMLANETDLRVPAGWARPVRDCIRNLGGAAPAADYRIIDQHAHMGLQFLEGDDDGFLVFASALEQATRRLCRRCGRHADIKEGDGICDGCWALQVREYKILNADEDGTDGY